MRQGESNGPLAGTAFYGGPADSGPFQGLQAEKARVPFAHVNLVKLPDEVSDDHAILLSDIFPTGYFGADIAEIKQGNVVAVFGCGPVGQFAIASAKLMGATRVLAVDAVDDRLDMAQAQGAEVVNFERESPVGAIRALTDNIGADRVIDAVGVDARHPHHGPGATEKDKGRKRSGKAVAKSSAKEEQQWLPGDAPDQVLDWAVDAVAKAGTVSIIGVYPETIERFPIGKAMGKNLTSRWETATTAATSRSCSSLFARVPSIHAAS